MTQLDHLPLFVDVNAQRRQSANARAVALILVAGDAAVGRWTVVIKPTALLVVVVLTVAHSIALPVVGNAANVLLGRRRLRAQVLVIGALASCLEKNKKNRFGLKCKNTKLNYLRCRLTNRGSMPWL